MSVAGPIEYVRKKSSKWILLVYALILLGLGNPLSELVRRGWRSTGPGSLSRQAIAGLSSVGVSLAALQALTVGILLGTAILMSIDRKKRVQALLIWGAMVLVAIGFAVDGFVPRVFLDFSNHTWLMFGGIAATAVISIPRSVMSAWSRLEVPVTMEFRRAPWLLYIIVSVVIVTLWFEYHVTYLSITVFGSVEASQTGFGFVTDHIIGHTFAAAGYLFVGSKFIRYDAQNDVFILGPRNAGKSMFLAGMWRTLSRENHRSDGRVIGHGRMDYIIDQLGQTPPEQWPFDNTTADEVGDAGITTGWGTVFPKNLTVSSREYMGESLSDVNRYMRGGEVENEAVVEDLLTEIEAADTIICLIDLDRVIHSGNSGFESSGIEQYIEVVREYQDEKQVVPVATKADLLDERFETAYGIDPYDPANYEEFREFVTEEIATYPSVDHLLDCVATDEIHPVYVLTTEGEDGERRPVNVGGHRDYYGYDAVLEVVA